LQLTRHPRPKSTQLYVSQYKYGQGSEEDLAHHIFKDLHNAQETLCGGLI